MPSGRPAAILCVWIRVSKVSSAVWHKQPSVVWTDGDTSPPECARFLACGVNPSQTAPSRPECFNPGFVQRVFLLHQLSCFRFVERHEFPVLRIIPTRPIDNLSKDREKVLRTRWTSKQPDVKVRLIDQLAYSAKRAARRPSLVSRSRPAMIASEGFYRVSSHLVACLKEQVIWLSRQ